MHNAIRANPEHISLSHWKKAQLAAFLIASFFVLLFLVRSPFVYTIGLSRIPSILLTSATLIAYLLFWKKNLDMITGTVSLNHAIVLYDIFTKGARAVFAGFYWKLPWEVIEYGEDVLDLTFAFVGEFPEDFPTDDGEVTMRFSLLSKIDSAEGWDEESRSERILTHCLYLGEVEKLQKAEALQHVREKITDHTTEEVIDMDNREILKPEDLSRLAREIAIIMLKCNVEDIDLSEQAQANKNRLQNVEIFKKVVKRLEKKAPSLAEAWKTAKQLDEKIDYKEEEKRITLAGGVTGKLEGLTLSPSLEKLIDKAVENWVK
jgi:hypothetical protein